MEIIWYGGACVRLRGKEGTVVADAFPSVVGPTGRGLTADLVTYSHPDPAPPAAARPNAHRPPDAVPTSLQPAFRLDGPGEYEIHDVLVTGVRTARDEAKGTERGLNTAFVVQLDGLHAIHLGDLGHALTEEQLREIGTVDLACVPIGGHLSAAKAAEVVSQLEVNLVVPLLVAENEADGQSALAKFLHEMGVKDLTPQPRLTVTVSSVPHEMTVALLESRVRV
ncbi:MAG: MBL fold metallo-hydrolase [Chloroflexi bacterium]|nr:MBL fold metallo-hydrolase [Chloroflexota bacterium]